MWKILHANYQIVNTVIKNITKKDLDFLKKSVIFAGNPFLFILNGN